MVKRDFLSEETPGFKTKVASLSICGEKFCQEEEVEELIEAVRKQASTLPDHLFLDEENRLYPCYDKKTAILSAIHADYTGENGMASKILKKAAKMGSTEVEKLISSILQPEKTVSPAPAAEKLKFAHVLQVGKVSQPAYPISNDVQLVDSAERLADDYGKLNMSDFRAASRTIVKTAASRPEYVQNAIPQKVREHGVERIPRIDDTVMSVILSQREGQYSQEGFSLLRKVATLLQENPYEEDTVEAACGCIEMLDKSANISYGKNSKILDPFITVFRGPTITEGLSFVRDNVVLKRASTLSKTLSLTKAEWDSTEVDGAIRYVTEDFYKKLKTAKSQKLNCPEVTEIFSEAEPQDVAGFLRFVRDSFSNLAE
jgi:hypothetical protein